MNKRSIAQEYYALSVNENGSMLALNREASKAGLVTAGIMELSLEGIIVLQKKNIMIEKELSDDLKYLAPLYEYLQNKVRSVNQLMNYYLTSTGERFQQLRESIGGSFAERTGSRKRKRRTFWEKGCLYSKQGL